jgi:predicted MFS family arabinose efflux permease
MAVRNGAAMTQTVAWLALCASLALLAASPSQLPTALVSASVFGAAYMTLTGLYLVTGIRLLPDRPTVGPVLPFLSIAIGQAVGSFLAGMLVRNLGYADAFAAIAAAGLLLALFSPLFPSLRVREAPDLASGPELPSEPIPEVPELDQLEVSPDQGTRRLGSPQAGEHC